MDWLFSKSTVDWMLPVLGNVSFAITFLSYAQKHVVKLRLLAILATTVGLVYNTIVHIQMPDGMNLWPVLFWLSIFWVQNIYLVVIAIREEMEQSMRPKLRELMVSSFPEMHSRDWLKLLARAELIEVQPGEYILRRGEATEGLMIAASGKFLEERPGKSTPCGIGRLWGELTYVSGRDEYNASPCDVTAVTQATYYRIPYGTLQAVASTDRMRYAIYEGIVRSAGFKHGVLQDA